MKIISDGYFKDLCATINQPKLEDLEDQNHSQNNLLNVITMIIEKAFLKIQVFNVIVKHTKLSVALHSFVICFSDSNNPLSNQCVYKPILNVQ